MANKKAATTECLHDGMPLEGETSAYLSGVTTCCRVYYKATELGPLCRCCGRVVVGEALKEEAAS